MGSLVFSSFELVSDATFSPQKKSAHLFTWFTQVKSAPSEREGNAFFILSSIARSIPGSKGTSYSVPWLELTHTLEAIMKSNRRASNAECILESCVLQSAHIIF